MRWSKIKNMILVLLAVVNLSLLALVGARAWQSERNEREMREQMVAVLEKSGITFLPDAIPDDLDLTPCKITVEAPGEPEAALLLGEITTTSVVGARTTYVGEAGAADFTESGEVHIRFTGDAAPEREDALELLTSVGVPLRATGSYSGNDGYHYTYVQLWNGAPVFGRTAELIGTTRTREITLRRLAGADETVTAPGDPLTAPTALSRFLGALNEGGYVCSQVTEMYPGYTASGVSTVALAPCWIIETDAWPWRFAVDAYSGEVTTVN